MVAERARRARLLDGLGRAPDRAGDHDEGAVAPGLRRLGGELQHRAVEPGLADGELRRVDADREPARASVDVVAGERPLRDAVELAARVEREWVRGNDRALRQDLLDGLGKIGPVQGFRHGDSR